MCVLSMACALCSILLSLQSFSQEQSIDLSWQQRHLQMTPLFAATQATQPGSSPAVPMAPGMLRATQQAGAFIPTQGGRGHLAQSLGVVTGSGHWVWPLGVVM